MRITLILLLALMLNSCKQNKEKEMTTNPDITITGYEPVSHYDEKGDLTPYNFLQPVRNETIEKYPLVVFLHGAGERGNDNNAQLTHIAPIFLQDSIRKKYPSYVLFPQCPENKTWSPVDVVNGEWLPLENAEATGPMKRLITIIDEFIETHDVDTNRIYISGLSMGGYGTFDILTRMPGTFAAALPICGGANLANASNYSHVPMKIFHGAKDQAVPVKLSRSIYQVLKAAGNPDLEYIEYPEGEHNVWNEAYEEEGILDWLYGQKKITE